MAERAAFTVRCLAADRRGNVALIVALLLPMLLIVSMGGIELNQVLADQRATQNVADAAALMGAAQLGVTPSGAGERAQAFALAQLSGVTRYATVKTAATVSGPNMTVAIDTQRASFFGSLFPPGGFHTHVSSTATGVNTVPLCVLGTASPLGSIQVNGTAQLQAGSCMIHSNASLTAAPAASISAAANEATTVAVGNINVAASQLAPSVADPFQSTNVNPPGGTCPVSGPDFNVTGSQVYTLGPGVHTAAVNVTGNGSLTLGPGDHYFCKTVTVSGNGSLSGTDTDMVFDTGANLNLSGSATLNLAGRQSGTLAGFVLVADRNVSGNFAINSDNITGLTGTVYVPTATLAITGTKAVGGTTPWTVIVAENLTVNGAAKLVINSNYVGSSVPVPIGVGNNRQNVKLLQ